MKDRVACIIGTVLAYVVVVGSAVVFGALVMLVFCRLLGG